jgi:hypothetical protein
MVSGEQTTTWCICSSILRASAPRRLGARQGKFAKTLGGLVKVQDPMLIVHHMLVLLRTTSGAEWPSESSLSERCGLRAFIYTCTGFVISQSMLKAVARGSEDWSDSMRYATVGLRAPIYYFDKWNGVQPHAKSCPWLMLRTGPILWCISNDGGVLFTDRFEDIQDHRDGYYIINTATPSRACRALIWPAARGAGPGILISGQCFLILVRPSCAVYRLSFWSPPLKRRATRALIKGCPGLEPKFCRSTFRDRS